MLILTLDHFIILNNRIEYFLVISFIGFTDEFINVYFINLGTTTLLYEFIVLLGIEFTISSLNIIDKILKLSYISSSFHLFILFLPFLLFLLFLNNFFTFSRHIYHKSIEGNFRFVFWLFIFYFAWVTHAVQFLFTFINETLLSLIGLLLFWGRLFDFLCYFFFIYFRCFSLKWLRSKFW